MAPPRPAGEARNVR